MINRGCLTRLAAGVLTLAAGGAAIVYLGVIQPYQRHVAWYRAVEDRILRLAPRRPEGMPPNEWAYILHWTWNLHCNCGDYYYFDLKSRDRFLAEFDDKLKSRVDVGTIDWIWDEYECLAKGGARYSRSYRPTNKDVRREWFESQPDDYHLQYWLDRAAGLPPPWTR